MGESDFSAVVFVSASRDGLDAVRTAAEPLGARVLWFASAQEALDFAKWSTERFAAFVDTRLDGWAGAARELRSLGVDAFPFDPSLSPALLSSTLEFSLGSPDSLPDGPVAGREWVYVRALLEGIPASVCLRDLEGRLTLYNRPFEEILRTVFREEPRPGLRTTGLMTDERKSYWEEVLRRAALGLPHREQFEWILPDGGTRFYELFLMPVSRGGRIFGTLELTRDITEDRRTNHILRLAQEIGRIGSWEFDVSAGTSWWSPMMYELFGFPADATIPSDDRLRALFSGPDGRRIEELLRTAIESSVPFTEEFELERNGVPRWLKIQCAPVSGADGRARLLRGVVQDIDEAKRSFLALKESEARSREFEMRFTAAAESARDAFLLAIAEDRILEAKGASLALSGYRPGELVGMPVRDLEVTEADAGDCAFRAAGPGIETARYEARLRRKDKTTFDAEITKTRFSDSGTQVVIIRDIDARKARERQDRGTSELLEVLASASALPEYLGTVADILRRGAGCDAVGIRLEKDGDYPLAASSGLDPDHAKHMETICARDSGGRRIEDPEGGYVLNCFCGAAAKGRRVPGAEGYGPAGSLWLDDIGSRVRRKNLIRGTGSREFRCMGEGYKSFIIVPLRQGNRVLGILQFLSRKKGAFNQEDISVFEAWAARIAGTILEREAAEALARSEERFRRSLDAAPLPILIHTEDGRIEALNEAWKTQTGTGEEIRKLGTAAWSRKAEVPGLEEYLEGIFLSEEIRAGRFEERTASGGRRLWDLSSRQIGRLRNGRRAAVTIARDVTEAVGAEERELERQRRLLESEKLASLGTLVAGVAHEINNPNHVIMLSGQMLADAWDSLAPILDQALAGQEDALIGGMEYRDFRSSMPGIVGGIRAASGNIATIVRELREFSAPEGDVENEEVDLSLVAAAAATLLGGLIRGSTDRFRLETAPSLPTVLASFVRLEQVVINLVMNACQALESRDKAVEVRTGLRDDGRTVFLEVRDEGCGMDAGALAHVKDPFYTSKRGRGGLGLGVPLSNSIVEAYGGRLRFESSPGTGTRAVIELPIAGKVRPAAE